MSRCRKVRGLLGPYVYGDLSPAERAVVEEHLRGCEACRRDFEGRRALVGALPEGLFAPDDQSQRRLEARVAAGIEQARGAPARTGPAWGRAAVAVAAGLLLCCAIAEWSRPGTTSPVVVVTPPRVHREAAAPPAPPAPPSGQTTTTRPAPGPERAASRPGPHARKQPRARPERVAPPLAPAPAPVSAPTATCTCVTCRVALGTGRAPGESSTPPALGNDACAGTLPVATQDNDARLVELPTGSSAAQPGGVPR